MAKIGYFLQQFNPVTQTLLSRSGGLQSERPNNRLPEGHAATVREALSRNVGVDAGRPRCLPGVALLHPPLRRRRISAWEPTDCGPSVFILVSYVGMSTLGVSNAYVRYIAQLHGAGRGRQGQCLALDRESASTLTIASVLFGI